MLSIYCPSWYILWCTGWSDPVVESIFAPGIKNCGLKTFSLFLRRGQQISKKRYTSTRQSSFCVFRDKTTRRYLNDFVIYGYTLIQFQHRHRVECCSLTSSWSLRNENLRRKWQNPMRTMSGYVVLACHVAGCCFAFEGTLSKILGIQIVVKYHVSRLF